MSKNRKNVNEEINEEVMEELTETVETPDEEIEVVEKPKKKIPWKGIAKIAVGAVVLVTAAVGTILCIGGFTGDTTTDIYTDENGNLVIHDNTNDSKDESEETDEK